MPRRVSDDVTRAAARLARVAPTDVDVTARTRLRGLVVVEGLDAGGLWLDDVFEPVRRRLVGARRWHEIQPVAQAERNVRDVLELRPDVPALAFGRAGDLEAFDSAVAAARWIEPMDVADGEYEALFTVDGYPHSLSVDGETVRVRRQADPDPAELTRRLTR